MKLFVNQKLDVYCVPFFVFCVLACGDKGSIFRPLLTYIFPFLLIYRYFVSKRYVTFRISVSNITPLKCLIFLYISWVFITTILSVNVFNSFYYFNKLVIFFTIIYIINVWLDSTRKYLLLLKFCCYAGFFVATSILIQYVLINLGLLNLESDRVAGMYGNVNTGGFVMSMLSLLCYYVFLITKRNIYLLLMYYCFISVFCTGSRAALLVFIIAFVIAYFRRKVPKKIFIISILIFLGLLFTLILKMNELQQMFRVENGTAGRDYLWIVAFQIIGDYFYTGIGVGNLKEIGTVYLSNLPLISDWERNLLLEHAVQSSHNMYLETFVDTGVIGLIFYLLIYFQIVLQYKRGIKSKLYITREFSYLLLGIIIAVAFRGLFESNGFLCKGWLNVDLMFWIFFVLYKRKSLLYVNSNNLSTTR
ncbi:O-antigen ligase family protein [Bacteroides nordii]|uniref:O-antigen ligase family protein n=2 Tax=Bacteroides nordii TaxID=291645 RepID=UPI00189B1553|nr:O-antigen ligase family protein [Bacteroides nordii]